MARFEAAASASHRGRALRYSERTGACIGILAWRKVEIRSRSHRALAKDALLWAALGTGHVLFVAMMATFLLRTDGLFDVAFCALILFFAAAAVGAVCAMIHAWRTSTRPVGRRLVDWTMGAAAFLGFCLTANWLDKHAPWWWFGALVGPMIGAGIIWSAYESWKLRRQRTASGSIRRRWFRPARASLRSSRVVRRLAAH
jgi:hypothetical protein